MASFALICFALLTSAYAQTNSQSTNTSSNASKIQSRLGKDAQPEIPVAIQGELQRIAAALEAANAPKIPQTKMPAPSAIYARRNA
jgi:hypothetical protein